MGVGKNNQCPFLVFAHWSVGQKLNHVSSVQLRRSVHALTLRVTVQHHYHHHHTAPLLYLIVCHCRGPVVLLSLEVVGSVLSQPVR